MEVMNKYITIKDHIAGLPLESDFELKTQSVSLSVEEGSDNILVKVLFVSVDPYQINRMKSCSPSHKTSSFAVPITPGEAIDAYGVGRVVDSAHPDFEKDDLVVGFLKWGEYTTILKGAALRKLDPMGFPLSYHVGILAFSGFTAYGGLFELGKPKKGDKVFVSAACGSVGNLVGQYAKLSGCYVVGSAGTKEKVEVVKEKLGFDDAFNYKEEKDLKSALQRYFPDGIDIYFDNVGADMLEAAVANMSLFGRVVVCGVISEYTNAEKRTELDMLDVVYKRITIQGFLASDFMNIYGEFVSTTADYLHHEKIEVLEDISKGVESIPNAFTGLFRGDNVGKKVVQISVD